VSAPPHRATWRRPARGGACMCAAPCLRSAVLTSAVLCCAVLTQCCAVLTSALRCRRLRAARHALRGTSTSAALQCRVQLDAAHQQRVAQAERAHRGQGPAGSLHLGARAAWLAGDHEGAVQGRGLSRGGGGHGRGRAAAGAAVCSVCMARARDWWVELRVGGRRTAVGLQQQQRAAARVGQVLVGAARHLECVSS
jgi:hypothetical protein